LGDSEAVNIISYLTRRSDTYQILWKGSYFQVVSSWLEAFSKWIQKVLHLMRAWVIRVMQNAILLLFERKAALSPLTVA
jgi:ABC-type proline/glycine betaine transport system permease subunit